MSRLSECFSSIGNARNRERSSEGFGDPPVVAVNARFTLVSVSF
jgi:hypothetical protein